MSPSIQEDEVDLHAAGICAPIFRLRRSIITNCTRTRLFSLACIVLMEHSGFLCSLLQNVFPGSFLVTCCLTFSRSHRKIIKENLSCAGLNMSVIFAALYIVFLHVLESSSALTSSSLLLHLTSKDFTNGSRSLAKKKSLVRRCHSQFPESW